ncbi:hypothetical protein DPMN_033159 [Dreissena polymorpha]|uniref:Uncharacterized protein n=1 Tax=Dreissena polymorpha TaxID=45954 RepID=A0A9D4M5E0_DREPO|nr:hypothetical protein DPMN_033151 [Dreissena polymorpha]KAH3869981.1 hypothetical protein DPMN_033159 [Dreissena polymorpha]
MKTAETSSTNRFNQTLPLYNDHRPEADDESPLIPKAEVTEAVRSLRAGKSPVMDKVPSELMIKRG